MKILKENLKKLKRFKVKTSKIKSLNLFFFKLTNQNIFKQFNQPNKKFKNDLPVPQDTLQPSDLETQLKVFCSGCMTVLLEIT